MNEVGGAKTMRKSGWSALFMAAVVLIMVFLLHNNVRADDVTIVSASIDPVTIEAPEGADIYYYYEAASNPENMTLHLELSDGSVYSGTASDVLSDVKITYLYSSEFPAGGVDLPDGELVGSHAAEIVLVFYRGEEFTESSTVCTVRIQYEVIIVPQQTEEPLAITSQPQSQTVGDGDTAYFTIGATGKGLQYAWQYKVPGKTKWNNCTSRTTGYNTPELQVVGAMSRNGYQYRCAVTDENGEKVTSAAVMLTVTEKSDIVFADFSVDTVILTESDKDGDYYDTAPEDMVIYVTMTDGREFSGRSYEVFESEYTGPDYTLSPV